MDAVTYLKERKRLERWCAKNNFNVAVNEDNPINAVRQLELWSQAHPMITNGDVIRRMIGEDKYSIINDDPADCVTIDIDRDWWEEEHPEEEGLKIGLHWIDWEANRHKKKSVGEVILETLKQLNIRSYEYSDLPDFANYKITCNRKVWDAPYDEYVLGDSDEDR